MGLLGLFKRSRGEASATTSDTDDASTPEQEPWYRIAHALGKRHAGEMNAFLDSDEITVDGGNEMDRRMDAELADATKGLELLEGSKFTRVYLSSRFPENTHSKASPEEYAAHEARAVDMALRHVRETDALCDSSERSADSLRNLRERQEAELADAKKNMAVRDALDFGEAYSDARLEETAPSCDDDDEPEPTNPIAEALARRHGSERLACIEDDSGALRLSDAHGRHQAELADAVQGLEESEARDFRAVYVSATLNLMVEEAKVKKVVRTRRNTEVYELFSEQAKYDEIAEQGLKLIAEGKPVAEWVRNAYDRGRADGRARTAAMLADKEVPSEEWTFSGVPGAQVNAIQRLYREGEFKGENDAVDESATAMAAAANVKPGILSTSSLWDHQVAPIHFLAGDFGEGKGHLLNSGKIKIPHQDQVFSMDAVQSVELITQQSIKRVAKSWGMGLAGAAVFGPAGLVAGAVVGGNENSTTFAVTLTNGQRFLAVAAAGVHTHFLAATFARGSG